MKRLIYVCLKAATMFAIAVLLANAAEAKTKTCYSNFYDRDGDGYAAEGAPATEREVGSRDLHCPDGYRGKAGDCDDLDASVHPRTHEIGHNYKDDNCNGLVDEPTYFYYADGSGNRTNSVDVRFRINHPAIFFAARGHRLEIRARVAPLSDFDSNTRHFTRWNITYAVDFSTGKITLNNLNSGTVYAVRLFFYKLDDSFNLVGIGPNGDLLDDGSNELVDTERYYTMTDSAFSQVHNRFLVVLRGLAEYNASQNGEVGYRGTVRSDGRRYGADGNRRWCSEFYVWVTRPFVRNISGETVDDLMDFFSDRDSLWPAGQIRAGADPGDYLPLDTDEDGDLNHSAMFLAHDPTRGKVWTLEGNWGNVVVVKERPYSIPIRLGDGNFFRRLGHIKSSMWE